LNVDLCLFTPYTQSQSYIRTDGRSISKFWCRAPSGAHDQRFIVVRVLRSCFCGAPSLTRGRVCILYMLLVLASAVFLGSSSLDLATIFYCLCFETSLFVASYDSQGHGAGIRPRLHTGHLSPPYAEEAYCRQPAGTLTPGIGPRWDPWPYICSMSRTLFCFVFPLVDPPYC
jgi:hypothetical protein